MNPLTTARAIERELKRLGSPKRTKASLWFFKTEKGQYGYGDIFYGATVPEQRRIASRCAALPLSEIKALLVHPVHECRLTGLFILVQQYEKGDVKVRARIAKFYLAERARVNNWDLVDASAPYILGDYVLTHDRAVLYRLARSKSLWDRRIAVVATARLIRDGQLEDTFLLCELLLRDQHDLMHKACGWMLREAGKQSRSALKQFLKKHAVVMPRTMLRYAIEHFPERDRQHYLRAKRGMIRA